MYVVSRGWQSWAKSQHSIMQLWQEEYRTTLSLLFLTDPKCNILLASNIKWQTVNAFKTLTQPYP